MTLVALCAFFDDTYWPGPGFAFQAIGPIKYTGRIPVACLPHHALTR